MTKYDDQLAVFLRQASARPFEWGVNDCCANADAWIQLQRGISPISAAGIAYWDEASAERAMADNGGLAFAMRYAMGMAGIDKVKIPQSGDVGVVKMLGRVCAAIFANGVWFARDKQGMLASGKPDRVVAIWRIIKE